MPFKERYSAAQDWIEFIHEYVALLDAQLRAISDSMAETVTACMGVISEMSRSVAEQTAKADEALFETRMTTLSILEDSDQISNQGIGESKMRRLGGKFAKSVESLSLLDDRIGGHLMSLMGSLSNEDVVIQRLEHVITGISLLKGHLGEFVALSEQGLSLVDVNLFKTKVLSELFASYTMEEEKKTHRKYFTSPVRVTKVA